MLRGIFIFLILLGLVFFAIFVAIAATLAIPSVGIVGAADAALIVTFASLPATLCATLIIVAGKLIFDRIILSDYHNSDRVVESKKERAQKIEEKCLKLLKQGESFKHTSYFHPLVNKVKWLAAAQEALRSHVDEKKLTGVITQFT